MLISCHCILTSLKLNLSYVSVGINCSRMYLVFFFVSFEPTVSLSPGPPVIQGVKITGSTGSLDRRPGGINLLEYCDYPIHQLGRSTYMCVPKTSTLYYIPIALRSYLGSQLCPFKDLQISVNDPWPDCVYLPEGAQLS